MSVENEGASKVCGFCANLVDQGVKLEDDMFEYLITFLTIQGHYLPTKVCEECFKSLDQCMKFTHKCRKNLDKLKSNRLSTAMILGRSREEIRQMKDKFKDRVYGFEGAGGLDDMSLSARSRLRRNKKGGYDPVVNIRPSDRYPAEKALGIVSSRGRQVKNRFKANTLFDDHPQLEKPKAEAKKTVQKVDPDLQKEYDDEEIFPSVGPYQCEICQKISDTKHEFVGHIKAMHRDMVDEHVLRSLEKDLKKKRKKEQAGKSSSKKKSKPKAKKRKVPKKPRKPKTGEESDEDGDDDDDYTPSGKKKKRASTDDADGGSRKGVECELCGTMISRRKDLAKHQTTSICKKRAEERGESKPEENGTANVKSELTEDGEGGATNTPASTECAARVKEEKMEEQASETQDSKEALAAASEGGGLEEGADLEGKMDTAQANNTGLDQMENSNDSEHETSNMKQNSLDAKFKANIAKRYEAERESDESTALTGGMAVGQQPDLDTHSRVSPVNQMESTNSQVEQNSYEAGTMDNMMNNPTSADSYLQQEQESMQHSQQHQSVIQPLAASQHNFKPWAMKDSNNRGKETTIDFSTIDANHLSQETVEDLESQMAALHGNGIVNRASPWDI